MKTVLTLFIVVALSACSGNIYTVPDPKPDKNGRISGVLVYGYKTEAKKKLLDRIIQQKTGEITHSMYKKAGSPDYCEPDIEIEMVAAADFSKPYAIQYVPGWLETNKFGVTLDKGMLASVNSESSPGAKTAVETLQGLASLREGILDGYVKQADKALSNNLETFKSVIPASERPIRCTSD